jgi:transposase-like protein
LSATKGNKTEAARILGISRKNLYERLAREEKVPATGGQKSENADASERIKDVEETSRPPTTDL